MWVPSSQDKHKSLNIYLTFLIRCVKFVYFIFMFVYSGKERFIVGIKLYARRYEEIQTCLPTSFNGVKVIAKWTRDDPHLWQAEFILISHAGCPHIYTSFCSIILISTHIPNRMLKPTKFKWEKDNKMP